MASAATVSVALEGVDDETRQNVLTYLEINRLADREDLSELVIRLQHRKASGNIQSALRPLGYYAASVETSLEQDGERWLATYKVTLGERVRFRNVTIGLEGPASEDPEFAALVAALAPASGDALRHDRYEAIKNSLLTRALDRGYFEAQFLRRRLDIFPESLAADIELVFASGPRYRVGNITVEQDALHDWIVRRYLTFSSGDYFDAAKLLDLQYALYDSDYFSFVEVSNGEPDKASSEVTVRVVASAANRQRYRLALGYGTDTEGRVGVGWENRRINRRGHKLRFDSRLSAIKQEVTGRYVWPLSAPTRERIVLNLSTLQEDLADTRSRRVELGVTQSTARRVWERDFYVRLLREATRESGVTSTETLLLPGVLWIRSKTDDLVYPRRGSKLSAEVKGSHSALGSDVDFVQLKLQGKLIFPAGKRARLLSRAEIGATSVGKNSSLPASLRFFAGGDQSVRGFGLNTLGPVDENGDVVGGRFLLSGSIEYEKLITERWGMAAFVDAGNALNELDESLEISAGLGLRWLSPIGMVRLDVARPLNASGESPRLHLTVGAEL
ncbi:MAG: outer membrane protein assembly factor [Gammaproteobacteria bacterium]|nr:outer membrane protein assembly factor [Gammaproteobacteria bacterium]